MNGNKTAELEQRRVELLLRDDGSDGAPPRSSIDLTSAPRSSCLAAHPRGTKNLALHLVRAMSGGIRLAIVGVTPSGALQAGCSSCSSPGGGRACAGGGGRRWGCRATDAGTGPVRRTAV
ncbi:DUF6191 domain-containing protein [Streptomyces sp. NPDC048639]|uniref:DUF6191 domain-containing protein n=1 Tax=Streptomyces sp. NPDC048639 TaxID=3365581 RepID=UPI00371362EC